MFHFTNYAEDSKFFNPTNKKVIGNMKKVFEGKAMGEFVGLKSKMYSMKKLVKNLLMKKRNQKQKLLWLSLMSSKTL